MVKVFVHIDRKDPNFIKFCILLDNLNLKWLNEDRFHHWQPGFSTYFIQFNGNNRSNLISYFNDIHYPYEDEVYSDCMIITMKQFISFVTISKITKIDDSILTFFSSLLKCL